MSRVERDDITKTVTPDAPTDLLSILQAALDVEIARAKRIAEECDQILGCVGGGVYGGRPAGDV